MKGKGFFDSISAGAKQLYDSPAFWDAAMAVLPLLDKHAPKTAATVGAVANLVRPRAPARAPARAPRKKMTGKGVVDVQGSFRKMMSGDIMNATEERAVGHMALRASAKSSPMAQQASGQLGRAKVLADGVRSGAISGATGKQFVTVINIGIGGSDLGPGMVTRALRRFANGPVVKFVSNIDAADLDEALLGAVPETTLFIVSSKTFTTLETMHNAERARRWVQASVEDWSQHFVAATSDAEAAMSWGIQKDCCLEFFV
jgi:glucose-6-phosphate isomerase